MLRPRRSPMSHVILFVLLVGTLGSAQEPATPPWKLTDTELRARVGRVRAGRDLTPKSWPNGARVAVGLSFDLDSLMADDRPYEMLADGQPTGVVQLPVEWILDDAPYFWFDRYSGVRPTMNPDEVLAIWKAEFDVAYDERTMFILTMHPHIIGHRSRTVM